MNRLEVSKQVHVELRVPVWSIIHSRKEVPMKFTDGYWQMRANMTPHYAAQVYEVEMRSNAMTVYAPAGKLQERGHTVNQPLLTIRFSSPMENVIRVQLIHHKGKVP